MNFYNTDFKIFIFRYLNFNFKYEQELNFNINKLINKFIIFL